MAVSAHIRNHVVGYVAVFIALGGTAAALPGKNTVDSGDIKKAQVKTSDLANGAVKNPKLAADAVDGSKVADNAIKGVDVDEASLDIPQQALPTSLPPSGAAGGDLSGDYPNPQVQESALATGGDLGGSLANAQIAGGTVGDAELADRTGSIVFPASEIADAGINVSQQAEPTVTQNGFAPALGFGDGAFTDIVLDPIVPADRVPGSDLEVRILWTVADPPPVGQGDVIWRAEALGVSLGDPVDDVFNPQVQAPAQDAGTADNLQVQTITVPGVGIQNGELLLLRIMRMAGAAVDFVDDDLAQNALLLGVEVRYPSVR